MAKKKMTKETRLLALLLLFNCILFPSVYFALANMGFDAILVIYTALAPLIALAYVIYNRGFSGKNVTPEMLPETMTAEEKRAFIEDSARRLSASRWVLTVLFPIILALALDIIYLFLIPMIKEMLL